MTADTLQRENNRLKEEIARITAAAAAAAAATSAEGDSDSKSGADPAPISGSAITSVSEVMTLQDKIAVLQSELNGLRATSKQTDDEKRRYMELYANEKRERAAQAQKQGSVAQLQSENETLKTEKAALERKLETLEASARSASEQMMDLQVKMQQLRESFSFAQIQQAHQELSKARDDLRVATSVGEDLQRENDELRANLDSVNQENSKLARRVQKLEEDLTRAQQRDQLAQVKIEALLTNLAEKEKKLEVFARERAMEAERWSLREGEIRQEHAIELATLRERQRTDTASLHERIQALTAERNALGAQCLSMRTELKQLKAKKDQNVEAKLREELALTKDMLQRKSQSLENIMVMMAELQAGSLATGGGGSLSSSSSNLASISAAVGTALASSGSFSQGSPVPRSPTDLSATSPRSGLKR